MVAPVLVVVVVVGCSAAGPVTGAGFAAGQETGTDLAHLCWYGVWVLRCEDTGGSGWCVEGDGRVGRVIYA